MDDDNDDPLMNSEDEQLFDDENTTTATTNNEKENEGSLPDAPNSDAEEAAPSEHQKKKKRVLKRKRDNDKEVDDTVSASERALSDTFRKSLNHHKRDRDKEDDNVDDFMQREVEKEMHLSLGGSSSDDSGDEDDEPPAKKRRLLKKKDKLAPTAPSKSPERPTTLLSNLDALINSDDLDYDDAEAIPRSKNTNADTMEVTTVLDMDKSINDTTSRPTAPPRLIAHNGWPVLSGSNEVFTLRCTYAEHNKGPFEILKKEDGDVSANAEMVRSMPWGVFAFHGYKPEREKKDKNDENHVAFEDDSKSNDGSGGGVGDNDALGINDDDLIDADNDDTAGRYGQQKKSDTDRPWMILVGDISILRPLSSPLFMHRVRVVRVNPEQVVFTYKRAAPIYYAYEILEKRALWSIKGAHQAWTPIQLSRIMMDTLYIHLELYKAENRSSQLEHVLSGVKYFPLHSDPANKMLPPDHVPLNDYSNRKDRSTDLRNKLTSRVKTRDKAVATLDGNPVIHCRDLMQCTLGSRDLLFDDLEKPASAWALLDRGVPYVAISKLTSWMARDPQMVKKRFAATRVLYSKDIGEVNVSQLEYLGTLMELDPSWFADWFNNLENNQLKQLFSTPEALAERVKELRLEMYGIFCASHFLHAYQEKRLRFGANYHYIFSKDTCEQLFERGWLHVSDYTRFNRRMANEPENEGAALDEDTQAMLRVYTGDHLKAMNEHAGDDSANGGKTKLSGDANGIQSVEQKAARPILVEASVGSQVLVHPSVVKRSQSMAKLIMEVGMRWASYCRVGHLSGPLATLPPLTIQSAYLYGPASANKLDSMYTRLLQTVKASPLAKAVGTDPSKLRAIVIRADDDPGVIFGLLRNNLATLCMIIMDRFHVWSEALIDTVLDVMTAGRSHSQCTHLFITAYSHSFSDMNTSGLMFDDLVETARRLRTLVDLPSAEDNGNFWLASDSRFLKNLAPGDASLHIYSTSQREEQLAHNQAIVKDEYTFMTAISKFAAITPPASVAVPSINLANKGTGVHQEMVATTIPRPSILILFALKRTEMEIKKFLAEDSGAWGLNTVTMVSYETLSRYPSQTAGDRHCVMLFDLDYSGAGHATFLHINAALERCKGELLVFRVNDLRSTHVAAKAATTAGGARLAFGMIKKVFMLNDSKTDRLATRNQRLSLLKKEIERYFKSDKLMSLFKTTND